GGWRFQVPLTPFAERKEQWSLTPAVHIAGKLLALDGKTPLDNVVVELVQPEGSRSSRAKEAPTSNSAFRAPRSALIQSVVTSPATTNRVLQLDGNGSYVELPAGAFTNHTELTVE